MKQDFIKAVKNIKSWLDKPVFYINEVPCPRRDVVVVSAFMAVGAVGIFGPAVFPEVGNYIRGTLKGWSP